MKAYAKDVVILNAVKDLEGTHGKILHIVQNDTTLLSSFFMEKHWSESWYKKGDKLFLPLKKP